MTISEEMIADFMAAIENAPPSDYRSEGLSLSYGQVERGVRIALEAQEIERLRSALMDAIELLQMAGYSTLEHEAALTQGE